MSIAWATEIITQTFFGSITSNFQCLINQMFLYQPKTLIKDILGNTNLYHVPAPHSRVPTPRRTGTKIYPIYGARLLNLMAN